MYYFDRKCIFTTLFSEDMYFSFLKYFIIRDKRKCCVAYCNRITFAFVSFKVEMITKGKAMGMSLYPKVLSPFL